MQSINVVNNNYNKEVLLNKLFLRGIKINEYANLIFDSPNYNYKNSAHQITIVQLTLNELGLCHGGNFGQIEKAMKEKKLDYCPLEFAPYIRLHYTAQKISNINTKNEHPPDSILIFSEPLIRNDEFPKGFYIRNIAGTLWLRAYICAEEYVWTPNTELILQKI